MSSIKVEFWSDFVETPLTVFRNLSDDTIERRMRAALEAEAGDADIWALRERIGRDVWQSQEFCLIKQGGVIFRDPEVWATPQP